jgi:hypothetical protein
MNKVLTIQRSKWRRGGGDDSKHPAGPTRLLNEKGFMCCLGFDALACGVPAEEIHDVGEPEEIGNLETFGDYYTESRFTEDQWGAVQKEAIRRAIKHNDADELGGAAREALIREDLIALGWDDVVFID